jgi:hypothetical protein
MDIHPMRTEAEYEEALGEIAPVFEATPQTPEGDRLDVFVTLVEAHEPQHYSIRSTCFPRLMRGVRVFVARDAIIRYGGRLLPLSLLMRTIRKESDETTPTVSHRHRT